MNRGKKPANTGSGSPVRKGGEDVTADLHAVATDAHADQRAGPTAWPPTSRP